MLFLLFSHPNTSNSKIWFTLDIDFTVHITSVINIYVWFILQRSKNVWHKWVNWFLSDMFVPFASSHFYSCWFFVPASKYQLSSLYFTDALSSLCLHLANPSACSLPSSTIRTSLFPSIHPRAQFFSLLFRSFFLVSLRFSTPLYFSLFNSLITCSYCLLHLAVQIYYTELSWSSQFLVNVLHFFLCSIYYFNFNF